MDTNRTSQESIRRVLTSGFTVRDIAEPLVSFDSICPAETAREINVRSDFDVVGVRVAGRMVGYVRTEHLTDGVCGDRAQEFDDSEVIDDSTGFAHVVTLLSEQERLFVSQLGAIGGIVTRDDLEKAPVRMWLFGFVTIIEQRLVRLIELNYTGDTWKEKLSPARFAKAESLFLERRRRGHHGKLLDCLQLSDKGQILVRDPETREQLGFESRRLAEQRLKEIEALRNNLAHSKDIVDCDWETVLLISINLDRVIDGPEN